MDIDIYSVPTNMKMTATLWDKVKWFKPVDTIDNFGHPMEMNVRLIYYLDDLREYLGYPIRVYCAYELTGHVKYSQHKYGRAVDCCVPVDTFDLRHFFFAALHFPFNGIGIYRWWNPYPGLHLDTRVLENHDTRKMWWRDKHEKYYNIDFYSGFEECFREAA